jgi:hypothetical protein
MTFDSAAHPRATDGTFAEKVGASPEIALPQDEGLHVIGLPRDEGMGIIYTDLDVLQYAKDYYEEDWETSEDREAILAERRDEYLTYRQTTNGIEEAARYFNSGAKETVLDGDEEVELADLPATVRHNAIEAALAVEADDVEGIRAIYALGENASDEWNDHEFGGELADIIGTKILTDPLKLPRDDEGRPVYDFEGVAQREKYHRAAKASLEVLASGAKIPANLDHWGRVYWAAEEKRTPAELAKVLLTESEGEFARVILDHKKVTPEMVTYAARSNDGAVQHAVIQHPKVTAAALREVQARVERDYAHATDPLNAWGTMKSYYDQSAAQASRFMGYISDARGRLGADGAW